MRRLFVITGAALLCAMTAGAWNYPQYEAFAGYNFIRYNPDSGFVPSFNLNGGNSQLAYNFNKWFAGVIDSGAATKGDIGGYGRLNTTVIYATAGPRITFFRDRRFQPYAQVLFGGAYWQASRPVPFFVLPGFGFGPNPNLPDSTRFSNGEWGFAMLAGGGVDVKVSKHFYIRPAEASYFLTHMSNPFVPFSDNSTRNNFRYSGGVKVTWGEPK